MLDENVKQGTSQTAIKNEDIPAEILNTVIGVRASQEALAVALFDLAMAVAPLQAGEIIDRYNEVREKALRLYADEINKRHNC